MKVKKIGFLKPRALNLLFTFVVLFLPLFREQYHEGQYVAWYRPIDVIINYFQNFQQPYLLLVMAIFLFTIYFFVSLAIAGLSNLYTKTR
jgi:hypothetical protein